MHRPVEHGRAQVARYWSRSRRRRRRRSRWVPGARPEPRRNSSTTGVINAVGAENEYANVLSQIGGRYVHVSSILDNPNTDPHTFEASTERGRGGGRSRAHRAERVGYDDVHGQDRIGLPEPGPEGDRGPTRPRPARQHAQPASLVRPEDHAGGGQGHGDGPRRARPGHRAYFQARLRAFDASLTPWLHAIAAFKATLRRNSGRHHRAGGRLPARGHGHEEPDAVRLPGRHHERRGSGPRGHHAGGRLLHQASGQGLLLQPAGGRLARPRRSGRPRNRPACRSSGSTRRCPHPATTTSPGWWPRWPPSRPPWPTEPRRSTCDRGSPSVPVLEVDEVGVSLLGPHASSTTSPSTSTR